MGFAYLLRSPGVSILLGGGAPRTRSKPEQFYLETCDMPNNNSSGRDSQITTDVVHSKNKLRSVHAQQGKKTLIDHLLISIRVFSPVYHQLKIKRRE
ncbi:unnamed protein product [Dovyalis caffra]|uniref:Uncharacterized protein n=1 Tax=Dovyalis caffra TaxID=77055 RepID=A0AAV1SAF5_9ROSI|nr:unnamed protein product [Dovyalis caffra]